MSYEEFTDLIQKGEQIPDYYDYLLVFAKDILTDIALTSRKEVASKLDINYMKLTNILPLLKAYINVNNVNNLNNLNNLNNVDNEE